MIRRLGMGIALLLAACTAGGISSSSGGGGGVTIEVKLNAVRAAADAVRHEPRLLARGDDDCGRLADSLHQRRQLRAHRYGDSERNLVSQRLRSSRRAPCNKREPRFRATGPVVRCKRADHRKRSPPIGPERTSLGAFSTTAAACEQRSLRNRLVTATLAALFVAGPRRRRARFRSLHSGTICVADSAIASCPNSTRSATTSARTAIACRSPSTARPIFAIRYQM